MPPHPASIQPAIAARPKTTASAKDAPPPEFSRASRWALPGILLAMVRTRALFCFIACGAGIGIGADATAVAATVHLRAPDECTDEGDIVAEVDSLIGRPLSDVPGMKFEVEIARATSGKFRLRLDTIEGAETRTRELAGNSCTELANVASVAIAM